MTMLWVSNYLLMSRESFFQKYPRDYTKPKQDTADDDIDVFLCHMKFTFVYFQMASQALNNVGCDQNEGRKTK